MEKAKEILNTYYLSILEIEKIITNKDEDFFKIIEITSNLIVDLREQNINEYFIKKFVSTPRFLSEQINICTHPVIRERMLAHQIMGLKQICTDENILKFSFNKVS